MPRRPPRHTRLQAAPAPPAPSRLGVASLWVLVLTLPFVFVPDAKDAFRLPQLMVAEGLGLASLLAFSVRLRAAGVVDPWRQAALWAVLPLVLAAVTSAAASDHPQHSGEALADLGIGAACLVGWSVALPAAGLRRLLDGLVVPASLVAVLGILQFHGLYRPFLFTGGEEAARVGIASTLGNAADLGAFLVLPCLLCQLGLRRSAGGRRLLWGAGLAVCLYALAATQTLSALAALLVSSLVLWGLGLPARRLVAAAALIALAAAGLGLGIAPLRERLAAKASQLVAGDLNELLSGRLDGWRAAGWMLAEEPWWGVGHGAFVAEFARAKLALLEAGVPFYRGHVHAMFSHAHNELLQVAAEMGLLGFAALAWGGAVLGRALAALARGAGGRRAPPPRSARNAGADRARRKDRGGALDRALPAGDADRDRALALAGVTGYGVLALAHFPFHIPAVAYPALLFLAWLFAAAARAAPWGEA